MSKARKLRELMARPGPIVIIGAHNGLSAKIGEEAGFDGLWASGFEISASYAVPDANILTMAENLHAAKMMNNTSLPVIADCDNGYGNAVNVIRCVEEYEAAGIAAICMEDNIFPKRCSFYAGVKRELAEVEEHALKVRAAKAAQRDRDFVVIARTEALIAGWGMEEALRRGRAYADAGADMVLIHSKSKDPDEVLSFARAWDRPSTPLVCVPTIYRTTSVETLHKAGFKLIIFANHAIRSSIKAMTETLQTLKREMYTGSVDDKVVPLERVYQLVGVDKMKQEESSFLPSGSPGVTAVILAAGQSQGLLPLTEELPKPMLDLKGKSILERQIDVLNACGVKDVAVVRGYKKEAIKLPNARYYDNDEYATTNEAVSLFSASKELNGPFVFLYGDIMFERGHLEKLLKSPADISIVVDRAHAEGQRPKDARGVPDLVVLKDAQEAGYRFVGADAPHQVARVGRAISEREAHGEFVGMAMFTAKGARLLTDCYRQLQETRATGRFHEAESLRGASFTDLLQELIDRGADVQAIDVYKGWLEIDTFEDYRRAWALIKE
ncbi:phosphoenolpyruvate mutase [Sorangium cellulosum]|uniref:Phosphoenolpyruvate mutase n=1 Tax=Sorangium cellulosum TaxID=56 RepID=A0A150R304_SORCE|nr:phosphoenolpyruvate mutase [Sorangium cellulosum]